MSSQYDLFFFSNPRYHEWQFIMPSYLSRAVIAAFRETVKVALQRSHDVIFEDQPHPTHTFRHFFLDGIETLEIVSTQPDLPAQYVVYCCGLGENAMNFDLALIQPQQHYVVWNYPGMGFSQGVIHSVASISQLGHRQVKRLLNQGILANNITVRGFSLGGGVAASLARQLHDEGHAVNLELDRTFSRLSGVIPAYVEKNMGNKAPFASAVIALTVSGVSLGTTWAGFAVSFGVIASFAIAAIGYLGECLIRIMGFLIQKLVHVMGNIIVFLLYFCSIDRAESVKTWFNWAGDAVRHQLDALSSLLPTFMSMVASFVDVSVNAMGSLIGVVVALSGLVVGALMGVVIGLLLSIQLVWTDKPCIMPMTSAFRGILYSCCSEMDSVKELRALLVADDKPEHIGKERANIRVLNTLDDELIPVKASLNVGLGFVPQEKSSPSTSRVQSFWYQRGGHLGQLEALLLDDVDNGFDPGLVVV